MYFFNNPAVSSIGGLFCLGLGIFVLANNPRSKTFHAFFFMNLALMGWFVGNAFSMFYYENFELSLLWYKVAYTAVPFLCVTYYHIALNFFNKPKKWLNFLYGIAIIEVLFTWLYPNIREGMYMVSHAGVVFEGMPFFSYFLTFGMVKYIIISLLTSALYFQEYERETNQFKRNHIRMLSITFLVVSLGAVEWAVAFDIPIHAAWTVIPIFTGLLAYSMLKYKLFVLEPEQEDVKRKQRYTLKQGYSYLISEKKNEKSLKVFIDQVLSGKQGLYITRKNPKLVRNETPLKKTPMIWLTELQKVEGENILHPDRIEELNYSITHFLKQAKESIILLEGATDIINHSNYDTFLNLISVLKDTVSTEQSILIMPVDPQTVGQREFALLSDELEELDIGTKT